MSDSTPNTRRLSLSSKTMIGFALGILCGLFFGEICGNLQPVGTAFIGLLQMTVLPFIVISLTASVGRLSVAQARRLGGSVGVIALAFWIVGLVTVVLMAISFPARQAAAFYSNSMLETPESLNFIELFIPTNPFRSLANNWIPAVVVFSVGLGSSVMLMSEKSSFLARMDDWLDILKRLNNYVVLLTPYGVFAMVASAAGTITLDEFSRIQGYLLSYSAGVTVLTFLFIPAIITTVTPFSYRDILGVTLQAMLTAFATAKLIIVLPLLTEKTKELFEKYGYTDEEVRSDVEVIYPLMYPIPNLGKLLTLVFIPFVSWFVGSALDMEDYPGMLALGSVTYFGKPIIAMPFLLDTFRLPADMFQLFIVADVYCSRIGDVLAVMHLFAITTLGTCAAKGLLTLRWPRLAIRCGLSTAVGVVLLLGLSAWLSRADSALTKEAVVEKMQLLRHAHKAEVLTELPPSPTQDIELVSHIDAIRARNTLRVGYLKDRLPYSYFNKHGDLVGLDVELAYELAEELQCKLQFMPYDLTKLEEALNDDQFDFAIGGLPITTQSLLKMRFSDPYLEASLSLVVRDHRRKLFADFDNLSKLEKLTIAVTPNAFFEKRLRSRLPNANFVKVDSRRVFFEAPDGTYDAHLLDAQSGAAWTFLYPSFRAVVPKNFRTKVPIGFAVQRQDDEFAEFLSHWLDVKKQSGDFDAYHQYWILGKPQTKPTPRWSILRTILNRGQNAEENE